MNIQQRISLLNDPLYVFGAVDESERETNSFFCEHESCGGEFPVSEKVIVWNEASPKKSFYECCRDCAPKKQLEVNTKFIPFQIGTPKEHFAFTKNLYSRGW